MKFNVKTAGLGYSVWVSGVALSIWLTMNRGEIEGKRVLELGSGVGITGLSCALAGASNVVLSDFGLVQDGQDAAGATVSLGGGGSSTNTVVSPDIQPAEILDNLSYNVGLNR